VWGSWEVVHPAAMGRKSQQETFPVPLDPFLDRAHPAIIAAAAREAEEKAAAAAKLAAAASMTKAEARKAKQEEKKRAAKLAQSGGFTTG